MRRLVRFAVLAGLPAVLAAAELRFEAPSFESPRYAIRVTVEFKTAPITVKQVLLNGIPFEAALLFHSGKLSDRAKALGPGTYELLLDYAWTAKKKYAVTLVTQAKNSTRTRTIDYSGVSPTVGGLLSGVDEGFYRVWRVQEEAGIERHDDICTATVTDLKTKIDEPRFRLFEGSREIPYQVLARKESLPPESAAAANPPALTYKLAFPLDAVPNEKKIILLVKGRPEKTPDQALTLTGEGLGKTIQNGPLTIQFHAKSGQILTIESPKEKIRLWNKEGAIHWNPDAFIPGIAWDHSFEWNPPQSFEETSGPLVYVNAREGPMSRIKDVNLKVRYVVEPDKPYFIVETRLDVEKDMGVIALRNDEMVLAKELFDTLMYRDKDGKIITLPLKERAEAPYGLVHIADPDVPWAGLMNMKEGYGFFTLRLEAANSNLGAAGGFLHKAGTYFYAPSDGTYVYWVRPLLYTWGDYATNNLLTFLPKGSSFYEKNAYIILRLSGQTPRELDALLRRLRSPLRIF